MCAFRKYPYLLQERKFRGNSGNSEVGGGGGGVEVSNANFVKTGMTPNWKYCNRGEEEGVKSKTVHRRSKDIF